MSAFPEAAERALANAQLRRNLAHATSTIRRKRAGVVAELPDWEALREAGAAIKAQTLRELDRHLLRFEASVSAAGATVHWARDAADANAAVVEVARRHGARETVKVKSLTTDEIGLNEALEAAGIRALETDFAELVLQLDGDWSSHILVPAIHRNRGEIRDLFRRTFASEELSDDPPALTEAARRYLRERFLSAPLGICGANFAVADTGTICVVESEGNGRMCTTLPPVLVCIVGIDKLIPSFDDLEVFLQLLPRSSTGERMNPYTSLFTGVAAGDGPRELHVVLLDNGRTRALADQLGRDALRCIRCSACLNICPVYARVGGHAYGSIYPGPIGAILSPQTGGLSRHGSLPYASSLCGACADVCPVKIDIPRLLVHLRGRVVAERHAPAGERTAMRALGRTFAERARYERAQRLLRTVGRSRAGRRALAGAPGVAGWTRVRELPAVPPQTFREWWRARSGDGQ